MWIQWASCQNLHAEGAEFASANVLEDWDLREGLKVSRIGPQFHKCALMGNLSECDVMTSLYQSGEA